MERSLMIKKITMYLAVLTLGFLIGIVVSFFFSAPRERHESRPIQVATTRMDEWHRLYEAAGMTGDMDIIKEVNDRLLCADSDGELHGVPIEMTDRLVCRSRDGSIQEIQVGPGSFWRLIVESQLDWSLENSAFVGSVTEKEIARAYVRQHQWPD